MSSKKILYLNHVSEKQIRECHSKDGRLFYSISFRTERSDNGWGSFTASEKQMYDSKDKNRDVMEGKKDVLIGELDQMKKVRVKKGDEYVDIQLCCKELRSEFNKGRRRSKTSSKDSTKPEAAEESEESEETEEDE